MFSNKSGFLRTLADELVTAPATYISEFNTSYTLLTASASFIGQPEQTTHPDFLVFCYSDVPGTLFVEFSINKVDWKSYPVTGFKVSQNVTLFRKGTKGPRYIRFRYVNGGSNQTDFALFVAYGQFSQSIAPLNQPLGLDSDAILTRPTWPWLDVARQLQTGITSIKRFGRNAEVGPDFSPIALGGIYRTPQSTSAKTLRIKAGGHANNTADGTGAREITLIGGDINFNEIIRTLPTAGTSESISTTTAFTRLYGAFVSASGTYATQAAGSHQLNSNIVIENSEGTEDWLTIDATNFPKSQSEVGAYTIPAGKTGYVKVRDLSLNTGKTVDVIFFSRLNADQTSPPYSAMRAQSVVTGVAGGSIETFGGVDVPFGPYVGPCDVGFMAKVQSSTGSVAIEFEIFLIDEI